jgi:hypothetical protein
MPIAALADSRRAVPAAAFLGAARVARQRIHGWIERDGAEMLRIAKDAKRVYDHRTTPVPLGLLESTAARWKALSRDGCLSQTVVLDRRDLTITDVRLVAAIGHCHQVADPRYRVEENEPALGSGQQQASFGEAGNGRGHTSAVRSRDGSNRRMVQARVRDLMGTTDGGHGGSARLAPSTVAPGAPMEIAIEANGGQWAALRCKDPATGHEFLEVRAFVSDD